MSLPVCIITYSSFTSALARIEEMKALDLSPIYIFVDGVTSETSSDDRVSNSNIRAEVDQLLRDGVIKDSFIARKNLGVGLGILTAVDWFFSNEEFGLVIEDDCQISSTGVEFAKDAFLALSSSPFFGGVCLTKYPSNQDSTKDTPAHGTHFFQSWGWGTTRAVWDEFRDYSRNGNPYIRLFRVLNFLPIFTRVFSSFILGKQHVIVEKKQKNLWAIKFTFFLLEKKLLLAIPHHNCSLHTPRFNASNVRKIPAWYRGMDLPTDDGKFHNPSLETDKRYEAWLARNVYGASSRRIVQGIGYKFSCRVFRFLRKLKIR